MPTNDPEYSREYMRKYRAAKGPAYLKHSTSEKARERKRRWNISIKGKQANKRKNIKNLADGKSLIAQEKNKPCADCGNSFPTCCMDFHHLFDKKFEIGRCIHFGLKRLKAEIAKCVVICSNCHRIRHSDGNGNHSTKAYVSQNVKIEDQFNLF